MIALRRPATGLILLALAACAPTTQEADDAAPLPAIDTGDAAAEALLYFPAEDGRLRGETRPLGELGEGVDAIRAILDALLEGPRDDSLHAPLPEGTTVGSVRLSGVGVAYVDLVPAAEAGPPSWGSRQEILAAYSVVHSICANLPGVESVAFLWNGNQPTTFAGQLDTRRPLLPDPAWLAGGATTAR